MNAGIRKSRINCARVRLKLIFHPNGRAGVSLIFDLSLRKRGAVVHTPIDRAQAPIDEPFFKKAVKGCEYNRLVLRGHGGVRLLKTPHNTDSLELLTLQI